MYKDIVKLYFAYTQVVIIEGLVKWIEYTSGTSRIKVEFEREEACASVFIEFIFIKFVLLC